MSVDMLAGETLREKALTTTETGTWLARTLPTTCHGGHRT
jgi:hypothetical protein